MRATGLLAAYVHGLYSLSGAKSASLYVPAFAGARATPTLYHDGRLPPLPELADPVRAEQFRRELAVRVGERGEAQAAPEVFQVNSDVLDGCLIGIFPQPAVQVPNRRRPSGDGRGEASTFPLPELLIGLRLEAACSSSAGAGLLAVRPDGPCAPTRPPNAAAAWLFGFARDLARHVLHIAAILDDPLTGLPGRTEFQAWLEREVGRVLQERRPLSLLLVNPDEFAAVNERISSVAADAVIGEIGERLRGSQRAADVVARYGSVLFASLLPETGLEEGRRRAQEVLRRLHEQPFLEGTLPLTFSVGVAAVETRHAPVRRGFDLIRRAHVALGAAKHAGGGCVCAWEPELSRAEIGLPDRLLGVFTGQMARDYRNMAVLSDTVTSVAGATDFLELTALVVKGLYRGLKLDRVGVFDWSGSEARLVYGVSTRAVAGEAPQAVPFLALEPEEAAFLEEARQAREAVQRPATDAARETAAFAVALRAGEACLGVLYLVAGRSRSAALDAEDLVFLDALAAQVALALDRARLAAQQRQHQERETRRLQAEVGGLRSVLARQPLLYRSPQMEALMAAVQQVAPTNATVLITGESGTGKELIARALHQLGPRLERPFVVVDCSAIPTALIESELFGHEKGAFTGAHQRRSGRLVQADQGTLLLDEIGDLPLELQSRLLRFVQERQVTPVGGGASRTVDVRVLAATNRDLPADVRAGRFRADLYYRLHVVHLEVPALRERPGDALHLARHFADAYSSTYGKAGLRLGIEAEAAVLRHPWPGNVRELQNRMMRAVIMCHGPVIRAADLGFAEATAFDARPASDGAAAELPGAPGAASAAALPAWDGWAELRAVLRRQVEEALAHEGRHPAPLGRWLAEDFVLEADAAARGVASQAAVLLGMPESTFRRRLAAAAVDARAGWSPRSASWALVRACLARLLRHTAGGAAGVLEQAEGVLLEEILARAPAERPRAGAALLGVSLPTFRRRKEQRLAAAAQGPGDPHATCSPPGARSG